MNAKNLALKFGFLAIIVATCVASLWLKGCKQGIDLRGGSELVYQIYTNEARQDRLKEQKAEDEKKLGTLSGDERDKLAAKIKGMAAEIEALDVGDPDDLSQRMIAIIKRRVDPTGTQNIEFRPMGKDRFAVRMPAAREDSRVAREKHAKAMDKLKAMNLRPSDINPAAALPPGAERAKKIAALALGRNDEALNTALVSLCAARDTIAKAGNDDAQKKAQVEWNKALEDFKKKHDLETAEMQAVLRRYADLTSLCAAYDKVTRAGTPDARREAEVRREKELRDFKKNHNLRIIEMQAVLQRYAAVRGVKKGTKQAKQRKKGYDDALANLRKRYPMRGKKGKEIDAVADSYKEWLDVRQYLDDPEDLKSLIAKAGQLEFRIAVTLPGNNETMLPITQEAYANYVDILKKEGPHGAASRNDSLRWFPINGKPDDYPGMVVSQGPSEKHYILLHHVRAQFTMLQKRGVRDWSLKRSYPTADEFNTPAVGFTFDERGAKRFSRLTKDNVGKHMAVLLDDTVYSCPVIRQAISDSGIISGNFSREEVVELVRILEAGSLPARLNTVPIAESKFGPALGKINRDMGITAAVAGIIAVAIFMLIYYVRSGFIADVALVLNIVLVLGVMSMFDVVFTLPGIAGVILTVGIAVDANVLIFERLREEQAKGQSVSMAIKSAYDRALSAIFDANVTTLITCLILGWVSTEEVKGFAITLGLGVAFSMFTALVVTRWGFQLLDKMGMLKKPVFMLHIIGVPKINWMAKRKWFWGVSAVMIVGGAVAFISQGSDILGIEFSAGTKAAIRLKEGVLLAGKLPDDELVRAQIADAADKLMGLDQYTTDEKSGFAKIKATARVEQIIDPNRVKDFIKLHAGPNEDKVLLAKLPSVSGTPAKSRDDLTPYFKLLAERVDTNNDNVLDADELKRLPPLGYWTTTTEPKIRCFNYIAKEAFGESLMLRQKCGYTVFKGEFLSEFGIETAAEDGLTRISSDNSSVDAWGRLPNYKGGLQDFEGGVVITVTDMEIAMSPKELQDRINQTREKKDTFKDQQQNEYHVEPLEPRKDGKDGAKPLKDGEYRSFAVFVHRPDDPPKDNDAWRTFATKELAFLDAALGRAEATDATNFDPSIAGDKAQSAIVAIVLSWLAIVGYLWFRFGSPQWGLAAVICLIHDVIIVVGLVAISNTVIGRMLGSSGFKIDLPMIAAILTVIGYSVNDTIVVFDRIRENRGKLSAISEQVINTSINQTLGRTLLTSSTTLIVVLIMFVWGGPGIHAFNYALLMGIIFGTYSSVAIASPLLLGFKEAVLAKALPVMSED